MTEPDDALTQLAQKLFGTREPDATTEEPDPATSNVVPTEGDVIAPPDPDSEIREYARALFDRTDY